MATWKTVETVYDQNEAELLAAILRAAGIPVQVVSDVVGGWFPQLVNLRGAQVQVPDKHYDVAAAVLAAPPEYGDSD